MIWHLALGALFFVSILTLGAAVPESSRQRYSIWETETPVFLSLGNKPEAEAPKPFHVPEIKARSAYVSDLKDNKVLFEKNASEPRPLASLTKLMTALLLEERVPEGIFIPISAEAIKQEGDDGFKAGENFRTEDLRDFMLVASSNDAAYAAAEFIGAGLLGNNKAKVSKFVALMNERARELGLLNSSFLNPHGLDQKINHEEISGAQGSAFDMALLMKYIFEKHSNLIEKTRREEIEIVSEKGHVYSGKNTNKALAVIPQLVGAKTGFTDLAGGNLVFIFESGFSHPILVSLLGSSEEGRFSDAKKIADAVLRYYAFPNP